MITMTIIGVLALSIGLRAVGFAMRCLGGVMRLFFGLFGLLFMPLTLLVTLVVGLGGLVLPVLAVLFLLSFFVPLEA